MNAINEINGKDQVNEILNEIFLFCKPTITSV